MPPMKKLPARPTCRPVHRVKRRSRAIVPAPFPLFCLRNGRRKAILMKTMASFSRSAAAWLASVFPQHTNHASLNPDVAGRFDDRPHLRVGRLQTDFAGTLAIKPFERRFFSPDQRNHDISGVGYLRLLAHHKVAVQDV